MLKIRVLVVDHSATHRTLLSQILNSDSAIEVVATVPDAYAAREKLIELRPDVMTLDIDLPRMDGLTFLEKVMASLPIRTLIISSGLKPDSELWRRALDIGAIDLLAKPSAPSSESFDEMRTELLARVKAVSQAKLALTPQKPRIGTQPQPGGSQASARHNQPILAIAASTGGTDALKTVLRDLNPEIPGTLIVQHMPPGFTKSFAKQLDRLCSFEVREAEDGDRIVPGLALLAPGNFHMELYRTGSLYLVRLHQQEPLHGVRPAADYLFDSVAHYAGKHAIGLILTGMGQDGAKGLLAMHKAGAMNIAQDKASSVVYGMPKMAIDAGGIDRILALRDIARALDQEIDRKNKQDHRSHSVPR